MNAVEDHKLTHKVLHASLDELCADYIATTGNLLSETTVAQLLEWSFSQTVSPTEHSSGAKKKYLRRFKKVRTVTHLSLLREIVRWRKPASTIALGINPSPLCHKFHAHINGSVDPLTPCRDCPVKLKTGEPNCDFTPFRKFAKEQTEEFRLEEYQFLRKIWFDLPDRKGRHA
jgi:hypothetical protein